MDSARELAPEIDRLVLAVNTQVGRNHGPEFVAAARDLGLAGPGVLKHFADFLLAGGLSRDLAVRRLIYRPAQQVLAHLDELEEAGLVAAGAGGLEARDALRPLLQSMLDARTAVAASLWSGDAAHVAAAADAARRVAAAAPDDYVVARAHAALPEPGDVHLLVHHRLTTLRYLRAHAHAAAWRDRGLTAPEMLVLTGLWRGGGPGDDAVALAELVAKGYATGEPAGLTAVGRVTREAVEDETNRSCQQVFDTLDDAAAARFLDALRALPGQPV